MNRQEVIQRMVLDRICDDYENVDQTILNDLARESTELGLNIERADVVEALTELVENGFAKAFLLSSTEPVRELEGMPSLDIVEENFCTYFYITKKGKAFHLSNEV